MIKFLFGFMLVWFSLAGTFALISSDAPRNIPNSLLLLGLMGGIPSGLIILEDSMEDNNND